MNSTTLTKRILKAVLVTAFWLIIWELLALAVNQELLLPSPLLTLKTWVSLSAKTRFWLSALLSLGRIVIGFCVGTLVGALLAFLTHYFEIAKVLLVPIIRIIRAVPVASFIILALVWVETEALPSFISAMMAAPMVWQNVSGALESDIDPKLLEMAQIYNLGKAKVFWKIVVPSIMPAFVSSSANALGFAWKSGIAAEVICKPALSIGRELQDAKTYFETPQVFAWTATVCVLSMLLELLLKITAARFGKGRIV